ncbi:MAG: hypothetical protein ACRDF6_12975, partial [bacterium]
MKLFGTEPATWVTVIMLALKLAVAFGLPLTDVQSAAIQNFLDVAIIVLGGILIRQSVISVAAVDKVQGKGAADKIAAAHRTGQTQAVTPTSFILVALLGGTLSLSACASSNALLANADDRIHDGIAAVDDRVRQECPAPTEVKHLLAEVCQEARKEVDAANTAYQGFNVAASERKLAGLAPLIEAVGRLKEASVKGFSATMQTELARLIKQIADVIVS